MSDDAATPVSDPPLSPSGTGPASDDHARAVVDLLGTVAYGELTGFSALAADAATAPTLEERILLARLAAGELVHYERLAARLRELGADPVAAMTPFMPAIDAYHARTRGSSWPERLVKAYVGDGIRSDFYREIAGHVDPETAALVADVSGLPADRDDDLVAGVQRAVEASPVIEGRLSLWGRRLMGEAISQAQRVLADRESLATLLVGGFDGRGADLGGLGRVAARMSENHAARMARLGLNA